MAAPNTDGIEFDYEDETPEERPFSPLSTDERASIISNEIHAADLLGGTSVHAERRRAIRYYYGQPFGNEIEGRSKVVLTDVADTIDWIMPSLMRMFFGGPIVVRYKARRSEHVEKAEHATQYINMLFRDRMDGYQVFFDWFKTALLEKNGFVKVYAEERVERRRMSYEGMTEPEFTLLADEGGEIVEFNERPSRDGQMFFDATVIDTRRRTVVRADSIPPEEFLIARRAVRLNDETPFSCHRVKRTVSDLIAMGVPAEVAKNLPRDETPEFSEGRTTRLSDESAWPEQTADRRDVASQELWLNEVYIRMDADGDGYSELRKVLCAGDSAVEIIYDEEVGFVPFCSITPNPMPNKFVGLSTADQVADLQLIRSTLLRQMLDNLYLINNSRYEVVDGAVDLDDLLSSAPGGYVRTTAPGMVTPLVTAPLGPMAMHMMEFLDGVRETRTGVSKWQQGPDASSLSNQTRGAVSQVMQASYAKIEQIARTFAETGVRPFFQKLLRVVVESATKPEQMRFNGQWIEIDPRDWHLDMDIEVEVGLGVGQAQERIALMSTILMLQAQALQQGLGGTLVKPKHLFNAARDLAEAGGLKPDGVYFEDPGDADFPPPPPDPKLLEHERHVEEDKARRQIDMTTLQADAANNLAMIEWRQKELEMKERIEMAKIASAEKIAKMQAEAKAKEPKEKKDAD